MLSNFAQVVNADSSGEIMIDVSANSSLSIAAVAIREVPLDIPAQGLVVSTTNDVVDDDFSEGELSLREAILIANEVAGENTITFDGGVFTDVASSVVLLSLGELGITETLTIDASALSQPITIYAQQNSRVLNFSANTGDLTLSDLTVTGGTEGTGGGGGIRFDSNGTVALTDSTVSGNSGLDGGGIYADLGTVTLTDSTISGNTSGSRGGGINTFAGSVSLTNSTVSGNTSDFRGGGIYTFLGSVSVTNSTISGNTSGDAGGGINTFDGSVSVTNSTISGNTSDSFGGRGGGIYTTGSVSLNNSIVAGNESASDNDIFGSVFGANNLVGDGTGIISGLTNGTNGNQIGTSADPIDPLLGPLADNGGPTQTHALLPGSPAINAGDPAAVAGAGGVAEFDQRGFPRVVGTIDIGSVELQAIPDQGLVVSTNSDVVDGVFSDGQLSLREAILIANDVAGENTITFDGGVFTDVASSVVLLSLGELGITETLTIDASALSQPITIDAQQNSRVLNFSANTGDLTLSDLTVTGGRTEGTGASGGGIRFNSNGTITLTNSTISGNTSGDAGGGIYTYFGSVSVTNSTISGNTSGCLLYTSPSPRD